MKKKDHSLLFIFITIFIDITGLGIIIPVIPALITELINGSISEAAKYSGWLMFSYATLQFLFAPLLGGLSDHEAQIVIKNDKATIYPIARPL